MISIIFPGYRHLNWKVLYESALLSCKNETFEMIAVGPPMPELVINQFQNISNFRFILDYGAPTRCAQIALMEAKGEFLVWCSDDGTLLEDGIKLSKELLQEKKENDGICIRYAEGGNTPDDSYWTARTHQDLRLFGVKDTFKITPLGMYKTNYLRSIGGWDCKFEHLNMSNHDLAFRIQNSGGNIFLSPSLVFSCSWSAPTPDWRPVGEAYRMNDSPLFSSMYSLDQSSRLVLSLDNWKQSPNKWERRFGK